MLKQFNTLTKEYAHMANEVVLMAERLENPVRTDRFKRQCEKIKNVEFHIIVIGQFKRGKSTLINYFLGENILPTGVIPITSIITRIKFGQEPKAYIYLKNNTVQNLEIEAIDNYISEQKNPQNQKNVDIIEIYYPSEMLKNGVVLIDTPGIGSIHKHNTEEAYRYLPEADAAIFVTSSDAPVGELEMKFLQDAKTYFHKIFFLQNKMDHLSEKEREESINFSKEMIAGILEKDIQLYPISAKQACEGKAFRDINLLIESGMKAFETDLEEFLLKEKGRYLLTSYEEKIHEMIKELEENIDFKGEVLKSPIETLEQQVNLFREKVQDTAALKKEALALVEADLKEIIEYLEADIKDFRRTKAIAIKSHLNEIFQKEKGMNGQELSKILNRKLESLVEEEYMQWNEHQMSVLKDAYRKVITRFTNKLNQGISLVNEITYEIFKFHLAQPIGEFELIDKDTFYLKFGNSSPSFLVPKLRDFLFLLPKTWSSKIILTDVQKRVDEELEKNGNNLKWDYVSKLKDSKYIFESTYQSYIDDIVANIQEVIEETVKLKNQKKESVDTALEHYDELKKEVALLKERMENLKAVE